MGIVFAGCWVGWLVLAGCGGEDLFVSADLDHDERCDSVADESHVLARAQLDIAKGAFGHAGKR